MQVSQEDRVLGQLAVHYKLMTMEQVNEALLEQGKSGARLAAVLLQKKFLNEAQLSKLIEVQKQWMAKQGQKAAAKPAAAQAPAAQSRPQTPAAARPATGATINPQAAAQRPTTGATINPQAATQRPTTGATINPQAAAARPGTGTTLKPDATQGDAETSEEGTEGEEEQEVAPQLGMLDVSSLDTILTKGMELGASDIHIHAQDKLRMRLAGALHSADNDLGKEESEKLCRSILNEEQQKQLDEMGQIDFAHVIEGVGRFRGNIYRQQRGMDGVFRAIPPLPPTLEQLNMPEELAKLADFHQGMVLFTGPAGCGKSSTLAAMVDIVNQAREDHILTVEDPIEYIHTSKKCVVNQRQAAYHTESFARALRAALREDPDIIAIGELRDLETISLAITAAETGHLVMGTLHTNNAIRTINRLLGVFPPDQQEQIRTMVSESLRAIVSQRLIPRADGKGRIPALEILRVTNPVSNLIRENKTFQIRSILQTGGSQGMCLMDDSLLKLVQEGVITKEEALRHVEDAKRFK